VNKIKLSKRTIIGILAVLASILLVVLVVILINKLKVKSYDVNTLKNQLISSYESLYLVEMDHIDVLDKFGIDKNEVEDALYLKSLKLDDEGNDVTKDINYIIIMNTENYQEYYDAFDSHIHSNLMYSEDKKLLKLYDKNSILKMDENYVYFILSKKSKEIEEFINE